MKYFGHHHNITIILAASVGCLSSLISCQKSDVFLEIVAPSDYIFEPRYESYDQQSVLLGDSLPIYFSNEQVKENLCQDLLASATYFYEKKPDSWYKYRLLVEDMNVDTFQISFLLQIQNNNTQKLIFEAKIKNFVYEPQFVTFIKSEPKLYFVPKGINLSQGQIKIDDSIWEDTSWEMVTKKQDDLGHIIVNSYNWKTFLPDDKITFSKDAAFGVFQPFFFDDVEIKI